MITNFLRAGSTGALGSLLLVAIGCSAEPGSDEREAGFGQVTEAVCDSSYYGPICLSHCQGTCTDGSAIASCMSVCMGGYCSWQPAPQCSDAGWNPPFTPQLPVSGCQNSLGLVGCYSRCVACTAPGSSERNTCPGLCFQNHCTSESQPGCANQNRNRCHNECQQWAGGDNSIYFYCFGQCIYDACH